MMTKQVQISNRVFRRLLCVLLGGALFLVAVPRCVAGASPGKIAVSYFFDGGSIYFQVDCGMFSANSSLKQLRIVVVKPGSRIYRGRKQASARTNNLIVGYVDENPDSQIDPEKLRVLSPAGREKLIAKLKGVLGNDENDAALGPGFGESEKTLIENLITILGSRGRLAVWGSEAEAILRRERIKLQGATTADPPVEAK